MEEASGPEFRIGIIGAGRMGRTHLMTKMSYIRCARSPLLSSSILPTACAPFSQPYRNGHRPTGTAPRKKCWQQKS